GNPGRQEIANGLHILARGATHLPFAEPRFGTPCAANSPVEVPTGGAPLSMMADGDDMRAAPQDVERNDPTMMRAHDTHTIHG
ncbi:MAG: hypothetical protein EBT47_12190, partial [Chloroflexi bacterium]|nr:hypothetical protein [Chloroflexota bacterium]NCV23079.1 hypothetical protein [Chloroflexota bacterium]